MTSYTLSNTLSLCSPDLIFSQLESKKAGLSCWFVLFTSLLLLFLLLCMGLCVCTSVGWEDVSRHPVILNKSLIANQKKNFITI